MKTTRKVGLILGAVILIAALVSVYIVYSRQGGERNNLNDRLSTAQSFSIVLTQQKQDLENQLAIAQSSLDTIRAKFPESVKSIEYGEDLFKIAHDCNVELTAFRPSTPTDQKLGAITYSVSSVGIQVAGNIDDILKFINALRTGRDFKLPWSARVTSIGINVAGLSADINLDIYGYKG